MNRLFLCLLLLSNAFYIYAQTPTAPKYEFRGLWVATIGNIDWPSAGNLPPDEIKAEFDNLLYMATNAGINALIVQIRPASDAFYPSSYEGWSKYITGKSGMPPEPYWDPVAYMVEKCHEKGVEFHAWFNPYRCLVDARKNIHPYNHPIYTNPEWFVTYAGKKYFDPGVPEVRKFVQDVVMEVVNKYDIDAVHFDDYFYPYKVGRQEFPDNKSYNRYGSNFYDKGDWRRNNVNLFIEEMSKKMRNAKPTVKFGISPFGVWRNIANDPDGSNTNAGVQNYDDLFADVLLWEKKGWIDYMLPQLYWERGHRVADYYTLIDWWSKHAFGKAMYAGLGLYQVGTNKASAWKSADEIPEQIALARNTKNINGVSFYSTASMRKNKYGVMDKIQLETNKTKAIVPPMKWLDSIAPAMPKVNISRSGDSYIAKMSHQSSDANCYVIYKFTNSERMDLNDASKIISIQNSGSFSLPSDYKNYRYVVTSLDKIHNESKPFIIGKDN